TDDRHRHEPHRVSLLDSQHLTQMEFGVHLPLISFIGERRSLDDLVAVTKTANDLDYTHICANDHLVFSRPWLDGPTALAAMVAHSGRMTLATTVAVPVLRGPAATAKILAAIDLLSGGRLLVGLGPGSSARDYELVGLSFDERWKRLEEAVQVLRDVQAELTARGRDVARFPNGIATMWCYVTEDRDRAEAMLADVLAPLLNRPIEALRSVLPIGSAEDCAVKLLAYEHAGAQRVFLWPLGDECAQLELFRESVVPLIDAERNAR